MNFEDKVFLIDLDGTMYRGEEPIAGAKEFVEQLQNKGIPYLFVTNNAMRNPAHAAANLNQITGLSVTAEHFYTSVETLKYILEADKPAGHIPSDGSGIAYVIGTNYVHDAVTDAGFSITTDVDNNEIAIVVVGLDQSVTYQQLMDASIAVQNGARFYLTNPDVQFPSVRGYVPGAGALGKVITAATRVEPIVCGKPNALIIEGALAKLGANKAQAVFLGDNLMTDISAAVNAGIDSIMIETGVHNRTDFKIYGVEPTMVVEDYETLLSTWQ
ncbi:HAD-IIA family hydrolase [Aerococcus agrisoli]|uniref:HAD-IIA family hydrolase n=1 Tax=Aerococcus agrisoli TaxID=2487350 RepID=A0A3N4GQ95_9LACT|nr:HAD-IIA family hydrolase [Aerococcus agrisoli]RPA61251.1 HAD-IIA family hydrolase [Aerococcus agrisoli]